MQQHRVRGEKDIEVVRRLRPVPLDPGDWAAGAVDAAAL